MDLQPPFDQTVIQRILPHRYPFLLVDRITEFEPDKRIVGIKNVSRSETYLWQEPGSAPTMPFTILTEAAAQVGAILILVKPENAEKLILFMGIDRVRYRHPVKAGDQVELIATVKRLRSRMGTLHVVARVDGRVCCEGQMTFSLSKKTGAGDQVSNV
jgi:3-hydroxyacyl-[acyl-carrier-protein] dehydratase